MSDIEELVIIPNVSEHKIQLITRETPTSEIIIIKDNCQADFFSGKEGELRFEWLHELFTKKIDDIDVCIPFRLRAFTEEKLDGITHVVVRIVIPWEYRHYYFSDSDVLGKNESVLYKSSASDEYPPWVSKIPWYMRECIKPISHNKGSNTESSKVEQINKDVRKKRRTSSKTSQTCRKQQQCTQNGTPDRERDAVFWW